MQTSIDIQLLSAWGVEGQNQSWYVSCQHRFWVCSWQSPHSNGLAFGWFPAAHASLHPPLLFCTVSGMLRDAERQLKSSLMDQDMVVTYLELVKVCFCERRRIIMFSPPLPGEINTG